MTNATKRLRAANSTLIVIDIQDKLLVKIPTAAELVRNAAFLLDVAAAARSPRHARPSSTRRASVRPRRRSARRLPQPLPAKTAFSCCGAGTFLDELKMLQRPNVVLAGMETHVCVMQTALDLIDAGLHVFLPVDALAAAVAARPRHRPAAARTRRGDSDDGRGRRLRVGRRRLPPAVQGGQQTGDRPRVRTYSAAQWAVTAD